MKEKLNDFEFNPISALNLIDELLTIDIEMLDLQQQMYLQFLDIVLETPDADVLSIVKPYDVQKASLPGDTAKLSMYIWSEAQAKYEVGYIEEYLHLNNVTNAIVSVRKDEKFKAKSRDIFNTFFVNDIRCEAMISNNKLFLEASPVAYLEEVLRGIDLTKVAAIHLDVEPHTLDEWDANKAQYLQKYVECLKQTKAYCTAHGVELSVSIPVSYPEASLKEIYEYADNVYLMAYEHQDPVFLTKKMKEEFAVNSAKTTIALRAKDFKNRNEYDYLVKELTKSMSTTRFAMHDLETFVQLDEAGLDDEK